MSENITKSLSIEELEIKPTNKNLLKMSEFYKELSRIAMQQNVAIITATQTNRITEDVRDSEK